MTDRFFPEISSEQAWPFTIVLRHLQEDPGALDDPDCPYGDDVKTLFAALTGTSTASQSGEEAKDLDEEISRLYRELSEFGANLKAEDTAERNTYFRLSVTLLEKLLEAKERAAGLKQYERFTSLVLAVMEDELNPDQRTKIMHRLRDALGIAAD